MRAGQGEVVVLFGWEGNHSNHPSCCPCITESVVY